VTDGRLASLGLLVRPEPGVDVVRGRAVVTTRDGHEAVFTAGVQVPRSGGLVQFHARPTPLLLDVVAARVVFDDPVEVASADPANATETRIVLWMGQAGRD
jgi:hypothetical protein